MTQINLFKLIHAVELMNNENIIQFTKTFRYPLGISPILVLAELKSKDPQKQSELAETIGYTKGAMTHIAAKLTDLGLVERLDNANDRRAIQLAITPAGERALAEAQHIGQELFKQHFAVLNDAEIDQYLTIQEKLIQGIRARKQSTT
ncbi:MarR family winged helix-turn-helix transcriptional regulator [Lentibacillus salinarum]|uniref:MarR family winged helix-turn-helix transcriptional regulator n=1 Tax=Lentibacillus salinarum TaxID=446820 RepID=A0ABW3ZVU5_9BACI